MLCPHSVNQVDSKALGIFKALGVWGSHKQVQVVRAAGEDIVSEILRCTGLRKQAY